jgi:hypothetical protein
MRRNLWIGLGLAALLSGSVSAPAQTYVLPANYPQSAMRAPVIYTTPAPAYSGTPDVTIVNGRMIAQVPPGTQTTTPGGEGAMEPAAPAQPEGEAAPAPEEKLGPTLPEDVKILQGLFPFLDDYGIKFYGWTDMGYTYASVGHGLLSVETRENRFGDEYLLNQCALVLEKPLKKGCEWDFGFNITYYAGADAALLQPKGGIDDPPDNPRFSHDFRQLYLSAHAPILTEDGMDIRVGRMGTIIGYESALAPYRPFYSNDYQWFYSEDGAWTGFLTNLHVNKQLDVLNGMTLGANTFFTKRSHDSYCYIGQVNYWLQEEKKTLVSVSAHIGRDAIFASPEALDYVFEFRIQQNWSKYLTQVIQSDDGFCRGAPFGEPTGEWYSLYNIFIYHCNPCLDITNRIEWFDDNGGTVTGISTAYEEVTLGIDYHPYKWLRFRPEVRGDFADERAFGNGGVPKNHSQLTAAAELLLSY